MNIEIEIYNRDLKGIKEAYSKSKSWDKVITTVVYEDSDSSQEAFIDYVEEIYQTKVKDGKHLQKLTGIKEETLEGLEDTVRNSRESKYFRALNKALEEGAKYKDLLKIKPQDYGLPESWGSRYGEPNTAYTCILCALSFAFMINEPGLLMLLPDLRSIALDIEAPYSVLMDCYNVTNKGKKYGATGN